MNALLREIIERGWYDAAYVDAHTIGFDRLERVVAGYDVRARGRDLRHRGAADRGGRRAARHVPAAALDGAAGLLPVESGDGLLVPGQQPAPAARHDRAPGRRHLPDERPADGPEHPRDGRRRRPLGSAELGEQGAHPRARRALERRRDRHPALVAADPRDADLPLRRAGLDQAALDLRDEPGGLAPRARARAANPREGRPHGRRAGHVPHRDRRASRTSCCPPRAGARSWARSRTSTAPCTSPSAPSTRPARRAATSTSSSTTRGAWTSATATARR